jgi:hypothetical protein
MENSELSQLRERVLRLEQRVELLERRLGAAPVSPEPKVVPQPAPPRQQPAPPRPPREGWEQKIGGTWLNRLGVVVLLIGLAFFLKYAFDHDWIDEVGRVAIGYCLGALLLAGGFWYQGKGNLPKFGSGLGGAGIGAWFISTWAAYNYYQIFAQTPAFVIMAAVTVAGVALAVYWNSPALASLGLLGGYMTPLLIQGVGGYQAQFTYLLVLNFGALAVLIKKNWNGLAFISLGFTTLISSIALVTLYEEKFLVPFLLFISAYHLLFAIQGLTANLIHRSPARPPILGVSLASGVIYLLLSAVLLYADHRSTLALLALAWGLFYLIQMAAVHKWRREDGSLSFVLLSLALGYITLAVPIRFSETWITMIWAVQAAALIVIGWRTEAARLRGWGLAVLMLALGRLALLDLKILVPASLLVRSGYTAPWTGRLPALVLVVGAMLLTAWLYAKKKVSKFEGALVPWFIVAADILVLLFVLGEWSRWFIFMDKLPRRATAWTLTMAANAGLLLALWKRWQYKPLKILILVLLPVAMLWTGFVDVRIIAFSAARYISPWAGRLPGALLLAGLSLLATWYFGRKQCGWLIVLPMPFCSWS